jgi:ATP-dependent Clp protease ATP-binding subunit ClpC
MFLKVKATDSVNIVIKAASKVSSRYNNNAIASEHLLYGLTFNKESLAGKVLLEFNVSDKGVLEVLEGSKTQVNAVSGSVALTKRADRLFKIAGEVSQDLGSTFMGTEHLLFALLTDNNSIATTILEKVFKVDLLKLKNRLAHIMGLAEPNEVGKVEQVAAESDNAGSNLPDELLQMGSDLTLKAVKGKIDPIIGRKEEIDRVIEILCRRGKNNPILVGLAGVGKSAIIEGLAQKIVEGKVPESLQNKIVYSLDIGSLMAGTRYRGALEEKLKKAIDTIILREDIILFIDEIHTIMQAGSDKGEINPADMLKPYLARGELQTVGATTIAEYKKYIEKDKALERRFQQVMVNPPSVNDTILILKGLKQSYESYHNVIITDKAIESAVKLSDRYVTNRNLPDKAIDVVDEASSKLRVNTKTLPKIIKEKEEELDNLTSEKQQAMTNDNFNLAKKLRDKINYLQQELSNIKRQDIGETTNNVVDEDQIAKVISGWTKIPVSKITEGEKAKLLKLEEQLHKRIIGHDEAVTAVSQAIRRARVGLKEKGRPIGSFVFVGQTGVGKTELCKALAEVMFNDEKAMIRFDMSEYMESHSVSKLIGAPAGYVGYDDGGILTDAVKRKPYSVILFDEIEKAHPDIFNLMLQVLDDGTLTDSKGSKIDFTNTIIIFTSNTGTKKLSEAKKLDPEFNYEKTSELLNNELKKGFRPEFLNRLDRVIVFDSLKKNELAQIAKLMIMKLNKKLYEKNLSLRLTEPAFKYLIIKGTNEEYGARPLRRVIERQIEDILTEDLLLGKLVENSGVVIDLEDSKLVFKYVKRH